MPSMFKHKALNKCAHLTPLPTAFPPNGEDPSDVKHVVVVIVVG